MGNHFHCGRLRINSQREQQNPMSVDPDPVVSEIPGVIAKGRSNTPTETSMTVNGRDGVVTITQTARKPQARDVDVRSKLSLAEARQLRDELEAKIEGAEER